ncbi:NAD synthetase [Hydrogenibacillus schlegelii]|uniref:Glutamine-dependent NAD(+) synthetase n=1 Tax=Hydrogenibacillus schlegelii TaxID=1484 RepID=A0A179IRC4_HYDSH|nr:NAD synthetase [Hydrogenibacillus schlegelii]
MKRGGSVGRLRIGIAQINVTVGDLAGNAERITGYAERAWRMGADLVVFPELALTGYPPEDLVFRSAFVEANLRWLKWVAGRIPPKLTALVGFVDREGDLYNAAAVIRNGSVRAVARKRFLPNYGVFDEERYFSPGDRVLVIRLAGVTMGVTICEDLWAPVGPYREQVRNGGAEVILNLSASPFHAGKSTIRESMLRTRASDYGVVIVFANLVGGQDELIFDGRSLVIDAGGEVVARGKAFEEDLVLCDLDVGEAFPRRLHEPRWRHVPPGAEQASPLWAVDLDDEGDGVAEAEDPAFGVRLSEAGSAAREKPPLDRREVPVLEGEAEVYAALVLSVRDYARKNGFSQAVLGLSGGIDSSLVAAIAADALGPEQVIGVRMPSSFTSEASMRDAEELAAYLGIRLLTIPVGEIFDAYRRALAPAFDDSAFVSLSGDVAEENLQARIRGSLLMALSNKFGWLVLATGNKSEMAVGYATLYGDMAGGFCPLKDVPKTFVYRLAEYRNRREGRPVIPLSVLRKAPSAELRLGQKDEDDLPPYPVLDAVLELYMERDLPVSAVVARGYPEAIVQQVAERVRRSEYKRRQGAPGPKLTPRAFGRDRRYPITHHFRER